MRIYLAAPYTADFYKKRDERYRQVTRRAGLLMKDGHQVFSPITHSHYMAERYGCNIPEDQWLDWRLSFLEHWAEALFILKLHGWDRSQGIKKEMAFAKARNIPVTMLEYQPYKPN